MREIKFRIWDALTKKMIATGYHVVGEVTAFGVIDMYASENMGDRKGSLERYNDFVEMQFTGLKDKNNKDIYEGDIINVQDGKLNFNVVVEWKNFGWDAKTPNGSCAFIWMDLYEKFEIIGNIYENPELLKNA